jgi:hypothetical protein
VSDKLRAISRCLLSQQNTFKKPTENEAATRASFRVAQVLAKVRKPLTDRYLTKHMRHIKPVTETICPENVELLKTISLSPVTFARRI